MTDASPLRLVPQLRTSPRSPEHQRFNTLIGQIEKTRQNMALWQKHALEFRQGVSQMEPLRQEVLVVWREWVAALDRLLEERHWTRSERKTLRQLLNENLDPLLQIEPTEMLQALYQKHNEESFESAQRGELEMLKEMSEVFTGVDLGDTSDIRNEEEFLEHLAEKFAAHRETEQRRTQRPERRRQSAAQERREQEAQRVTQSVREVFRKLASALHPDREPDPQARAAKNELMQKVNRAYEASDLLTLLEVQLQIEQVSMAQIQDASAERLRHYNKVLAEQLGSLKVELKELKFELEMELGIEIRGDRPGQLSAALDDMRRGLRADAAEHKRNLKMLGDVAAVKRYLKCERARMQEEDTFLPF